LLIFRTTNWRALMERAETEAREDQEREEAAQKAGAHA
jgi:hypothetical protein